MNLWLLANKVFIPDANGEIVLQSEAVQNVSANPPGDIGFAFVKMAVTFVVLIALLFATYWFLRRFIQQRLQKGSSSQSIQILEKRMISAKTMLYLVEVEGKRTLFAESHLEIKRLESYPSHLEEADPRQ